jgi:hypothetical protein
VRTECGRFELSAVAWKRRNSVGKLHYFLLLWSEGRKRVPVVLRNDIFKRVTKAECSSNRLIFVNISAKPVGTVIMKVYMPTTDHDIEEMIEKNV